MRKTQKYESSISANVLLVIWEGITPEELLRLVIKRELYCARELALSPLDNTPKSVKDLLNETDPYSFAGNSIEDYEKEHPEVLKKPEPKTQKEALPPYLDGNNKHFAPELAKSEERRLKVFLCHSSADKAIVREIYNKLVLYNIDVWLDEEKLLPGHDWELEIRNAISLSDVIIVCLSQKSVTKAGYLQKEIKYALDMIDMQPESSICIIPAKLDECKIPDRLNRWHWVNCFEEKGYNKLIRSLETRAKELVIDLKEMNPEELELMKLRNKLEIAQYSRRIEFLEQHNQSLEEDIKWLRNTVATAIQSRPVTVTVIRGDAKDSTVIAGNENKLNAHDIKNSTLAAGNNNELAEVKNSQDAK